jgi:RAB6A-GEF complex partner protein 2
MRRVHAEHHSSFVLSNLRTTFSLDIPSDASPAFQVKIGGDADPAGTKPGGLEWKVRLCLLVAVATEASFISGEGVRLKSLIRDGPRGQWGSSWKATLGISPMERLEVRPRPRKNETQKRASSWTSFLTASLLGVPEEEEKMGDEGEGDGEYDGVRGSKEGGVGEGVNFGGGGEGWEDMRLETVECEVPIKVWPGNTAFKAVEVVFHV